MKKLLTAAALPLACLAASACQTIPRDTGTEAAVTAAAAAEMGAGMRCPRNVIELAVLVGARIGFDQTMGGRLTEAQRTRLDDARAATDLACGIGRAPAIVAPPESPTPI